MSYSECIECGTICSEGAGEVFICEECGYEFCRECYDLNEDMCLVCVEQKENEQLKGF